MVPYCHLFYPVAKYSVVKKRQLLEIETAPGKPPVLLP